MTKGKKRSISHLYEHDHGDTTENSVIQISGDFRRKIIRSRPARIQPLTIIQPGGGREPEDQEFLPYDFSEFQDSLPQEITDQVEGITVVAKERAKRYENSVSFAVILSICARLMQVQDAPLKTFAPYRDAYLDEMLFSEGRGMYMDHPLCPLCGTDIAEVRCKECFGEALLCRACTVKQHQWNPLHHVQVCVYISVTVN